MILIPLMRCRKGSKKGYKFGKKGKCYTEKNAKQKAMRQGRVIKWRQSKR